MVGGNKAAEAWKVEEIDYIAASKKWSQKSIKQSRDADLRPQTLFDGPPHYEAIWPLTHRCCLSRLWDAQGDGTLSVSQGLSERFTLHVHSLTLEHVLKASQQRHALPFC